MCVTLHYLFRLELLPMLPSGIGIFRYAFVSLDTDYKHTDIMKSKLLFFLLLAILLQTYISIYVIEQKAKCQVFLVDVTQMQSYSIFFLPNALLENSLILIEFSLIEATTVNILKDVGSKKTVYSSTT